MENVNAPVNTNGQSKLQVQKVIVVFSTVIFVGKVIAYFLTNSVGILTDALESTVNVITGIISLYAIYISIKPKDKNHPFGHGKVEFLSASLEGFLILLAGLIIIFEAIKRFFLPTTVSQLDTGIYIVAVSGLLNYVIGWYSIKVGKKSNSIALISGGKHLQSDTYSSIGLVIGLVLLYFTKIAWLDSAIALIFGTIIIVTGLKILRVTTSSLMDEADQKMIDEITGLLEKNRIDDWIDLHNLQLIKYGDSYHITCDLVLPWYMNIAQAHKEGEKIKTILMNNFSNDIVISIHTDECFHDHCEYCRKNDCADRKKQFVSIMKFNSEIRLVTRKK